MKNSLILEGVIYLVLRPLWITPLLDLQNSSYLTQPHLIIANYILSVHSVVLDMHSLMGCLEQSGTLCVIQDYFFILFLIWWVFFIIEYSRNSLDSNILKEVLVESSLKVRFRLCYSEIKWKAIHSEYILSIYLFSCVLKRNEIDNNTCHLFINNC